MNKHLVVVVALFMAGAVYSHQVQPERGVVKPHDSLKSQETKQAQQDQKEATHAVQDLVELMRIEQQHEAENRQSQQNRDAYENEIQRKLANYTLLLAGVGFLQFLVLVATVYVMCLQRNLMREHAVHLGDLAGAARNNLASTKESVSAINRQANEMEHQRGVMQGQLDIMKGQFELEQRPWVGMSEGPILKQKKSTKTGQYGFTVVYTIKNFGVAPALNTIVWLGATIADANNYELVKSKVAEARESGERIVKMTGDLLLPTAEKEDSYEFGESERPSKFVIPGCIVYRSTDGAVHHTELSYWIDLTEGEKATFHTAWFQSAD
jgi:hypothetical protein